MACCKCQAQSAMLNAFPVLEDALVLLKHTVAGQVFKCHFYGLLLRGLLGGSRSAGYDTKMSLCSFVC